MNLIATDFVAPPTTARWPIHTSAIPPLPMRRTSSYSPTRWPTTQQSVTAAPRRRQASERSAPGRRRRTQQAPPRDRIVVLRPVVLERLLLVLPHRPTLDAAVEAIAARTVHAHVEVVVVGQRVGGLVQDRRRVLDDPARSSLAARPPEQARLQALRHERPLQANRRIGDEPLEQ